MALFKIFKGSKDNLGKNANGTNEAHDGFAYFTPDDGKFYIDIEDSTTAIVGENRIPLSAEKADKDRFGNIIDETYLSKNEFYKNTDPYLFRNSGGDLNLSPIKNGVKRLDKIIGGSLGWNQLVRNGNFSNGTNEWQASSGTTITASGEELTVNIAATNNAFVFASRIYYASGHKYLMMAYIKSELARYVRFYTPSGAVTEQKPITSSYSLVAGIYEGNGAMLAIQYVRVNAADEHYEGALTFNAKNCVCFDLTAMFGTTIADYIYSLEQTTAGAGVSWFRKLFPKDYYTYNAGTMAHVQTSAHETVEFNQWDEEWELGGIDGNGLPDQTSNKIRTKNFMPVLPGVRYYCCFGSQTGGIYFRYYTASKIYIGMDSISNANKITTIPDNAYYLKFACSTDYGTTYKNDICINISYDGSRDGEYKPYVKHTYPLDDSLTLRGIPKLDANDKLYFDGDTYKADGTVTRRYGVVDLGTLSFSTTGDGYAQAGLSSIKPASSVTVLSNILCAEYLTDTQNHVYAKTTDKTISGATGQTVRVYDTALVGMTNQQVTAALSGVNLVYELATPTTETAEPYNSTQYFNGFGTEEFISNSVVPVSHETYYRDNSYTLIDTDTRIIKNGTGIIVDNSIQGETTIKAKLKSYTASSATATIATAANRQYAVEIDADGDLSVNVPWSDTGVRSVTTGSVNGTISVNTNGTVTNVAVKGLGSNAYSSTAYLPLTGGQVTGNTTFNGPVYLNDETQADSLTVGSLLVNGQANFVQSPTAPTPIDSSNDTTLATTEFVKRAFIANDAMIFKGIISTSADFTTVLSSDYKSGWTYRANGSFFLNGSDRVYYVESGDIIICISDKGTNSSVSDWQVVEHNIDGALFKSSSAYTGDKILLSSGTNGAVKEGTKSTTNVIKTITWSAGTLPTTGTSFSVPNVTGNTTVTASKVTITNQTVITSVTQTASTTGTIGSVSGGVLTLSAAVISVGSVTATTATTSNVTATNVTATKVTLGTAFSIPNITSVGTLSTLTSTTVSVVSNIS